MSHFGLHLHDNVYMFVVTLLSVLSVAGGCCGILTGGRCGSITMITRNCMHRFSPNWVCRWR